MNKCLVIHSIKAWAKMLEINKIVSVDKVVSGLVSYRLIFTL